MSPLNVRLAAAQLHVPRRARRQALEELFVRTAAARLAEYARFTCEQAEEALACSVDGSASEGGAAAGGDPAALAGLERRLYRAARGLGGRFRLQLGVRSPGEALAAARVLYRGLGIDFRASADGEIVIRRCSFAPVYTSRVCALVSALDRGLLAGLASGGELAFGQRLTEGACCCRAHFEGASS